MPETSTVSETLNSAWEAISGDLGKKSGHYSRRILKDSGLAIFVNLSEPEGLPGFFLEVAPSSVKALKLAQSARGFDVSVERAVSTSGEAIARVAVRLTHRPFADLFDVLAADVVERASGAASEKDAAAAVHTRLEHWRRFAEKVGPEGLSPHEQTGLFGELLFLKSLLSEGVPGDAAVSAWHGPLRDNQDFCFGATAVEVKASTSNTPQVVTISNERQLDTTGIDALYLIHVSMDRRKGYGKTLPSLVEEVSCKLRDGWPEMEFLLGERLLAQGYVGAQDALYREHGFTERARDFYEVKDGFPRIVESQLCGGVSKVRYRLDLAVAADFRVAQEEIISRIGS